MMLLHQASYLNFIIGVVKFMKNNIPIGQKFNYWTVIGESNETKKWKCQCDCGTVRNVLISALKSNHSKSCGCLRKIRASEVHSIDLTGKKIGQLEVLERVPKAEINNTKHRYIIWKCRCSCGNIINISSDNLKRQKSCGCIKSFGEQEIKKILDENNITYIREFKFKELGNLRFDFYLPDFNRLIEFDGIQHFITIDYFGGLETLEKYQKNDFLKNQFAKQNNIDLVRIPYYLQGNITKDILLDTSYLI